MVGGAYLCYEGFEKVFHSLTHGKQGEEKKKNWTPMKTWRPMNSAR